MNRLTDHTDQRFIHLAESVVSGIVGSPIRLEWRMDMTNSWRSKVSIYHITEGQQFGHTDLILKQARTRDHETYELDLPRGPAWCLANEWAGLQFLTESLEDPLPGPRFFGGDRTHGFILMENLGDDHDESLYQDDPEAAGAYLLQMVQAAGRLHARTTGKHSAYRRIREALGPTTPHFMSVVAPTSDLEIAARTKKWWLDLCNAFNVTPPEGWQSEILVVAQCVSDPGPFGAFTHGDFVPGNDLRVGNGRRLFDFEISDYRHALLDGAADSSIFQRSLQGRIPVSVQLRLRDAYRSELTRGCPEAGDDGLFYRALVEVCVFRCLFHLHTFLRPDLLTRNNSNDSASDWHRILKALDVMNWTIDYYGYLPILGATTQTIAKKLRSIWPDEVHEVPFYRPFRSGS